jgi:DNA-binding IclR family transcriptional regulator
VSVSACRPQLELAEEQRLGKLVIAAASRIADRLGGLGNMASW